MHSHIPAPLTRFIGRERLIREITNLDDTARLITLTGPSGCGKSRLAIEIAQTIKARYPDGVFWVELTSLTDPNLITPTVASVLDVRNQVDQDLLQTLTEHLQNRQVLLVLDNCEHLVEAAADFAHHLLQHAPKIKILATSQERLNLQGEFVRAVPALSLPDEITKTKLGPSDFESIALFIDRARAIQADFELTEQNAETLIQICRQLNGMPLAIELASAYVELLSLDDILDGLDDGLNFLVSRERLVTDPRHESLRAAMQWSYALLSPQEQRLFRGLGVFSGGFGLEAIEKVFSEKSLAGEKPKTVLYKLINKSLVSVQTAGQIQTRYHLLESIRIFALEKLEAHDEMENLRNRHLDCCVEQAEFHAQQLLGDEEQEALMWMEVELDNLRAALEWSLQSGQIEAGLRIANACSQFWTLKGSLEEGLGWLSGLLEQSGEDIPVDVHMNSYVRANALATFSGEETLVQTYTRELADLGESADEENDANVVLAIGGLVFSAIAMGDYPTAFSLYDQAIPILRETNDLYSLGMGLILQGGTAVAIDRLDVARERLEEGLALARESGDNFRVALGLSYYGDLARSEQNYNLAKDHYQRSLQLFKDLGPNQDLAAVLNNLGFVHLYLNDLEAGFESFTEALAILKKESHTPGIAESLIGFGALAVLIASPTAGLQLLAAGYALGGRRVSEWGATRVEFERYLAGAKEALSENEFQEQWIIGSRFSKDEALQEVEQLPPIIGPPESLSSIDQLTPREQEITAALVRGLSNDEIAAEYVISKRTVEKHVSNILQKLNFSNRSQIVRWGIEQGIENGPA